jgi:hypothetical protein
LWIFKDHVFDNQHTIERNSYEKWMRYFDYTTFYIVFCFLIFDIVSLKILMDFHFYPPSDYEREVLVCHLSVWICTSASAWVVGRISLDSVIKSLSILGCCLMNVNIPTPSDGQWNTKWRFSLKQPTLFWLNFGYIWRHR